MLTNWCTIAAGAAAGVLGTVVNGLYFVGFQLLAHQRYPQTGFGSIAVSSLAPPMLGAVAALALSRFTPKAGAIFAAVALCVTVLSFAQVLSPTLSRGVAKPPGFDALVLPMHVVVGATAAWLIPASLRRSNA